MALPMFVRKFIVDAVETGVGLILGLSLVFPGSVADAKAALVVVGGAVLAALVSAARRAAPGFLAWFAAQMGTDVAPSDGEGIG